MGEQSEKAHGVVSKGLKGKSMVMALQCATGFVGAPNLLAL